MPQPARYHTLRTGLAAALIFVSLSALAVIPSALRTLGASFEALSFGTSTAVAIDLMGEPKSRTEQVAFGVWRFGHRTYMG